MSGPRCNLPEERHAEILEQFDNLLTEDEEREIRDMFPQYLFFRNEYRDDGFEAASTPIRLCTCTACGESFEAVRGNYKRGKLHGEACNCPSCGRQVEGRAVYKYKFDMPSLTSWIHTAVTRITAGGALLITAGTAKRSFTWDELTGWIEWYPLRRYYIAKRTAGGASPSPTENRAGVVQCWKAEVTEADWACERNWYRAWKTWKPMKTVTDAFTPNYFYAGDYCLVGLQEVLTHPEWHYCQIDEFYHYEYAADLLEADGKNRTARWIVQYLAWYALHPQIEMAVKLGLSDAVRDLAENGKKNARLLNWTARKPEDFLRMRPEEAKVFFKAGMKFGDLRRWREQAPELSLRRYAELIDEIGKEHAARLASCAKEAGCGLEKAARYVEKLTPKCYRAGVRKADIIQTWLDYLNMAKKLGYDLKEETVAMPKDLKERHDAAAETVRINENAKEMKRYKRRRKQLEKQFDFSMGGLRALVPLSSAEIVREGKTLHHCVGGYAARHIEGTCTILFIRKARTPMRSFLTVELYQERGKWEIRQVHGYKNEGYAKGEEREAVRPSNRYAWFLEAWLGWVNAGSQRDSDGRPVLPGETIEKKERTA